MITRNFLFSFYLITGLFLAACKQAETNHPSSGYSGADTAMVTTLLNKAASFTQPNLDSLQAYAAKALTIAQSLRFPEGVARAKGLQSDAFFSQGNYTEAVSFGLQAIHLYDSLGMISNKIAMTTGLAHIYKEMGGEKGSMEYLNKGLELSREAQQLAETEKNNTGIINSLNEQGIILRDISKQTDRKDLMDTALLLYNKAIDIIERTGESASSRGKLYNNISQVYNEHYHDYPKALEYLFKAVDDNKKRNSQYGLSFNYGNISDVYLRMEDYKKAAAYGQNMLAVSIALKAPHRLVNAYGQLARVYKRMKLYDSALYYKELNVDISDSLNNVTKTHQIAEMQTKFETQKKEVQIAELGHENKIKNERLWLASGVMFGLGLLLVVLFLQKKKMKRQKEEIIHQSVRLQWLMKELHHRVKNNLQVVSSLLNLQSNRMQDGESKKAIRESRLRVQAMSLIHQRLYQMEDVTTVNFRSYMNDLAGMLTNAYGYKTEDIDINVSIEKEYLDVDTVMPLALLANEIITNSLKYAFKDVSRPFMNISLTKTDQQLLLSISDNGPGIPNTDTGNGFGKKLITILTQQLKADCRVETSGGTAYYFTIPYTKEKAA